MDSISDRRSSFRARHGALRWTLAGILSVAQFSPAAFAADPKQPSALPEKAADPGAARTSIFRSGVLETKEGLTLRLVADLGSVNIREIEPGASPVVRYTVHVETDANGGLATQLLNNYSLKAGTSSTGVEIASTLFPQGAPYPNAQFWVRFEIAIPRNYNVEVNTGAGDVTTEDNGGTASLKTQGGN